MNMRDKAFRTLNVEAIMAQESVVQDPFGVNSKQLMLKPSSNAHPPIKIGIRELYHLLTAFQEHCTSSGLGRPLDNYFEVFDSMQVLGEEVALETVSPKTVRSLKKQGVADILEVIVPSCSTPEEHVIALNSQWSGNQLAALLNTYCKNEDI